MGRRRRRPLPWLENRVNPYSMERGVRHPPMGYHVGSQCIRFAKHVTNAIALAPIQRQGLREAKAFRTVYVNTPHERLRCDRFILRGVCASP